MFTNQRRLLLVAGLAAFLYLWLQFRYAGQLARASRAPATPPRPRPRANASVWALMDRNVSATRLLELLGVDGCETVETLPSGLEAADEGEPDELATVDTGDVVPPTNRLIFAVHPGASGAGFLAQLLGTASERNRALHIPTALAMGGQEIMAAAARPLRESLPQRLAKAERIEQAFANFLQPNGVYIETNPNFILTFFDVVLERFVARGWSVDIVVLHRRFGRTLKSLVERGYYTRNAATPAEILSPFAAADRATEPPLPAAEMDEYDQLIAFMMDVYARGERLARAVQAAPNVRVVPLRFESLLSLGGAKAAFRALNLTWSSRSEQFVLASPIVDAQLDLVARLQIDTTLEYCEQRIDRYVALCGAACPDVSAYRGDVALRAAQTLAPFLDTFTSVERAADDLRNGVVSVRFADAHLQSAFRERLEAPALPAFAELPSPVRAAAPDATVVCVQFCFATAASVTTAQLRRLRTVGSLCDRVVAFAVGGGHGDDELRWPADAVARVTAPRLNRERDANIALSLARFLNATHVLFIERDAVLAPACAGDESLRRQLTSLAPGDAVRLGGGLVLALAIADDQFVGLEERAPPLPFADAPLSVTAREHQLSDTCQIGRLEDSQQRARWQLAWLRLFATAHRVELTELAVREIVPPSERLQAVALDAGALSMAREYAALQSEVELRAPFARRWLAQIAAQQAWFGVSDAQIAEWSATFNASSAD